MGKRREAARRALSLFLAVAMVWGGIPTYALADDGASAIESERSLDDVSVDASTVEDTAGLNLNDGEAIVVESHEDAVEDIAESSQGSAVEVESTANATGDTASMESDSTIAEEGDVASLSVQSIEVQPVEDEQNETDKALKVDTTKKTQTSSKSTGLTAQATTSVASATVKGIGSTYTYTGKQRKPKPTSVTLNGKALVEGTDYSCTWGANVWGTGSVTIHGKGKYTDTKKVTFRVAKPVSKLSVGTVPNRTYTGTARTPRPVVKDGSTTLTLNTDYTLSYANNKSVGTATVTIKGKGKYYGTREATFKVLKARNTLTAKGSTKKLSASTLSSASKTLSGCITVSDAQGDVTYSKKSGDACLTVNSTTGKVTVKKGTKAGSYSIVVAVRADGTRNYKAMIKNITVKVTVEKALKANPIKVTGGAELVMTSSLASASATVSVLSVSGAQGKVTYKKASGASCLSVNASTGKVTVAKGTAAGSYDLEVKVTAAGNSTYKSATKTVSCKVVVTDAQIEEASVLDTAHIESVTDDDGQGRAEWELGTTGTLVVSESDLFGESKVYSNVLYCGYGSSSWYVFNQGSRTVDGPYLYKKSGSSRLSLVNNGTRVKVLGGTRPGTYQMEVGVGWVGYAGTLYEDDSITVIVIVDNWLRSRYEVEPNEPWSADGPNGAPINKYIRGTVGGYDEEDAFVFNITTAGNYKLYLTSDSVAAAGGITAQLNFPATHPTSPNGLVYTFVDCRRIEENSVSAYLTPGTYELDIIPNGAPAGCMYTAMLWQS